MCPASPQLAAAARRLPLALAAALSGYLMAEMKRWERVLCTVGALCLIAPGLKISLLGLLLMLPVLIHQWTTRRSLKGLNPA